MASTTSQIEFFPKAFLAQGNGDLVQVSDFNLKTGNGGKQKHTLRRPGAGVTKGVDESTITFNFLVGENGFERDYIRDIQQGKIVNLRAKVPGGAVLSYTGIYTEITLDAPLDDAVKGSVTFVGALEDQRQSLVGLAA